MQFSLLSILSTESSSESVSAEDLFLHFVSFLQKAGINLLWAALVFVVGWVAVRYLVNLTGRLLLRSHIELTFHGFIKSLVKISLLLVLAIVSISILGVNTAPLIAALGAVGLAVSLAIKDSLSNFASGISLLSTKPFAVGDIVEIGGISGTVREINLFHTILITPDNKRVYIPNSSVSASTLINYSTDPGRRLDLPFSIGYGDDVSLARELILQAVRSTSLALQEPEPVVDMSEHGAHAVELTCRVWVIPSNYLALKGYLLEDVKRRFDEADISIPYPQLDVHLPN